MDQQGDQSNQADQSGQEKETVSGAESGSEDFELPNDISPPESMGGNQPQTSSKSGTPTVSEPPSQQQMPTQSGLETPKKSAGSYILLIFLFIVLVLGIIFFAAWRGWISNSWTDRIFGPATTPTPIVTSTPTPTWEASPTITSSPEIISNVNDETRKQDLATIKDALEKYFSDNSQYPVSISIVKTSDISSILAQELIPTYMSSLPDDPMAPQYYYGYISEDGTSFELTCVLEDKSDVSGTLVDSINIYKVTNLSD